LWCGWERRGQSSAQLTMPLLGVNVIMVVYTGNVQLILHTNVNNGCMWKKR
jgi:hypothetical protein